MNRFLILGGDSTLAKAFCAVYKDSTIKLSKGKFDVTNTRDLEKVIKNTDAKYVINCAALTDIEYCEDNPKRCFEVNSIAVANISRICTKYNKKFIHISSDYAVMGKNIYGYSKLISEKLVDLKNDLIIRTSFFSLDYCLIKNLLKNEKVTAYKNMFFNPVSITRLVQEIYMNKNKCGILNIFSSKKISKYDFAKRVAKTYKIDRKLIKPVNYKAGKVTLPLNSFVKSNINIDLNRDLKLFSLS